MKEYPQTRAGAVWSRIVGEAESIAHTEPLLSGFLYDTVFRHRAFERALAWLLADKLASGTLSAADLAGLFETSLAADDGDILDAVRCDLEAVLERDPAATSLVGPFIHFKGFQALQAHRIAHGLLANGREALAFHLQSRISEVFDVDIHPAARIGRGILIDHGTGVVIGETSVIGDNVSLLHEVTLGGTGKEAGDRHPKIGTGVMIGAGAKVLGNIRVGEYSKIAACSVVLCDVPPRSTVAGIPAKVVGRPSTADPARNMEQTFEVEYVI
ncbi:MAG: serine O-acetyltransferase [Verrucomicrobiota bacterium]|jgi:serine O-acetyltransferase|nr:serine O-acetyltransferase [Verrucomicrobiota bacterium]